MIGLTPTTGVTKLTFTCSGAGEVKGGHWPLQVRIVTANGYTCADNPDLDPAHGQGAWGAAGRAAVTTADVFANRSYIVGWVNCNSAGAAENTSTEVSSCGLKVDVTLSLEEGYNPTKNVEIASAKGIVAGCHAPGATVTGTAKPPKSAAVLENVSFCAILHHQGWERPLFDSAHAHKTETGQNAHWDAEKKQWINSKNGLPLTPETLSAGEIAKGLFFGYLGRSVCQGGHIGPWKLTADPYHAHNDETGVNAVFDTDKNQWIDAKTGKALTPDP
ncbi:MAG: hypothetical protein ACYDA3_01935 [Gaiellaceae bacterium]